MTPWLARLGRRYAAWRVSRDLDGLHAAGLPALRSALARGPVLVVANHVAWWDGIAALALGHQLGAEVALLARGSTLDAHPWMASVGVLPLHAGLRARASLRNAATFLDRPGRLLWVFPQGRQRPEGARPLAFQAGLARFVAACPGEVVPAALGYPFREVEVPAAAFAFGPPAVDRTLPTLEAAVSTQLDALTAWADAPATPEAAFAEVIRSRRAPQQAGLATRLLGRVIA